MKIIDKFNVSAMDELKDKYGNPMVIKTLKLDGSILICYQYGLIYRFSDLIEQTSSASKSDESPNQVIKDISVDILSANQINTLWFLGTKYSQSNILYNYKVSRYSLEYSADHSVKNFTTVQSSPLGDFSIPDSIGLTYNDIFYSKIKMV